jgi:hypothetical protein
MCVEPGLDLGPQSFPFRGGEAIIFEDEDMAEMFLSREGEKFDQGDKKTVSSVGVASCGNAVEAEGAVLESFLNSFPSVGP